jgi:hypothetical protein
MVRKRKGGIKECIEPCRQTEKKREVSWIATVTKGGI